MYVKQPIKECLEHSRCHISWLYYCLCCLTDSRGQWLYHLAFGSQQAPHSMLYLSKAKIKILSLIPSSYCPFVLTASSSQQIFFWGKSIQLSRYIFSSIPLSTNYI